MIEEKKRKQNDHNNNNKKDRKNWNEHEVHSLLIAIKALRCKEPSLISVLLDDRSVEEVINLNFFILFYLE